MACPKWVRMLVGQDNPHPGVPVSACQHLFPDLPQMQGISQPGYNPTFKVKGKLYHSPKFAQLYFYNTNQELDHRLFHIQLNCTILRDLHKSSKQTIVVTTAH